MVTETKINNAAMMRHRLGTVLIWLGVLTWLPFIVLRIVGEKPSLFWFLPVHLLGVVGGSRIRSLARKELGASAPKKNPLRVIGHVLIYAGILVWAPYFYLKLALQQPVEAMDFLPYHLTGILSGIVFLGLNYLSNKRDTIKE
jgi:polyferredoxin